MTKTLSKILYALYALYFVLNIIASPLVTYLYVVIALFVAIQIITSPFEDGIYTLLLFSFIEGQGRILLGYNFVARAALDILILLIFFKALISNKSLFVQEYLPQFLKLMIALHFLWWIAQLFHPLGLPPWFGVLTARYYIMPIFLFTLSLNIDVTGSNDKFQKFCKILFIFYAAEIVISYFQFFGGSEFLNKISPLYSTLFAKFSVFQGKTFRAFGTSFAPGGYVAHLYLGTPILFFINNDKARFRYIILPLTILFSWVAFFLSGVRSAWLKNIMIILGVVFFFFIQSKVKFISTSKMILLTATLILSVTIILPLVQFKSESYDLTGKIGRMLELVSTSEVVEVGGEKVGIRQKKKHRMDLDDFFNFLKKVEVPFGTGIGMGGINVPGAIEARNARISKDYDFFWTGDNLYFFLIFELGLGSLFILMTILTLPVYFLKGSLRSMRAGNSEIARVLSICFVFLLTIIIGAWGAVGILLAPESLFFWFVAGLGMRQYFKFMHSNKTKIEFNEEKRTL